MGVFAAGKDAFPGWSVSPPGAPAPKTQKKTVKTTTTPGSQRDVVYSGVHIFMFESGARADGGHGAHAQYRQANSLKGTKTIGKREKIIVSGKAISAHCILRIRSHGVHQ